MIKKLIITVLLKKEFIKKELPYYYNISYKCQNKNIYYYNIPNSKKIIKSNMKLQKISKLLLNNMIALDTNLFKKIKSMKGYKISNKNRKYKVIKNKCNMLSLQTSNTCEFVSQVNSEETKCNSINSINNNSNDINTKTVVIPQYNNNIIHCRSKSVTFVEDCLEQIRLFNISDPPNSINMTPTHYSTGKINSHSLERLHRRNRNDEFKLIPFTSDELKENALYDHPVRKHRPYSKFNMPYNLKMDFSFGDPIPSSSIPSNITASMENNISNYKLDKTTTEEVSNSTKNSTPKHERSPVLLNNYTYSSNLIEKPISFINEKEALQTSSSLIMKTQQVTSLPQLV